MLRGLILALVLLTAGCRSYRPSAPLPKPATEVRVRFAVAQDVVVRDAAGEATTLSDVTELHGSIVRAQLDTRLDSMRIRLGSASGKSGRLSGVPDGAIATIARSPLARVEEKSLDGEKTGAAVLLGLAGGAVLFLALLFSLAS